ncbi:hypothetical protein LIER_05416 [Lithospermum erythrorhizon]|uniref:Stigma-specific Stig1 family protein n=1 Tax=Lithospermum erythrorhizon TaxID=34254 RepID=A0AAV3P0F8_LITER
MMMKVIKLVILLAITMALTISLTMKSFEYGTQDESPGVDQALFEEENAVPAKRVSRFLAEEKERNPRAADHCHKDNEICGILEGKNSTCCNNKCMDLENDNKNCGACKKKCKYAEICCNGECINPSYDKRHCGECNNKCGPGCYCIYGMCDYA